MLKNKAKDSTKEHVEPQSFQGSWADAGHWGPPARVERYVLMVHALLSKDTKYSDENIIIKRDAKQSNLKLDFPECWGV